MQTQSKSNVNELVRKLIKSSLQDIALAFSIELQPNQALVYIEALEDLSELQVRHAFKRAVKSWRPAYGQKFPSVADLREYADEIDGPVQQPSAQSLEIDPEKLPKGWTEQEWKRAKLTLQVTRANANRHEPDENPYESRKDYAARLIAEMKSKLKAGLFEMPADALTYDQHVEAQAKARLGPSEKPDNPEELYPWARQKAKDMGWTQ